MLCNIVQWRFKYCLSVTLISRQFLLNCEYSKFLLLCKSVRLTFSLVLWVLYLRYLIRCPINKIENLHPTVHTNWQSWVYFSGYCWHTFLCDLISRHDLSYLWLLSSSYWPSLPDYICLLRKIKCWLTSCLHCIDLRICCLPFSCEYLSQALGLFTWVSLCSFCIQLTDACNVH